jgi:signal recognition particle receptor subunit beta
MGSWRAAKVSRHVGAILPWCASYHVCHHSIIRIVCFVSKSLIFGDHSLVVDAADEANFSSAKKELDELLSKNSLQQTPILVLANKSDLPNAKSAEEVKAALELGAIADRELCIYAISCKNATNIDITLEWILKHAKTT